MTTKLDFFTRITAIHFPTAGRVLLDMNVKNSTLPPGACTTPQFNLGSKAKLLDKTEVCTKVTIPEHTVTTTFYFTWVPELPLPTPATYQNPVVNFPSPYDLYATQMGWVFLSSVTQPGPPAFATSATDPDLLGYIARVNAELGAHPGGSFTAYDTSGAPVSFIATTVFVASVTVSTLVPAITTSTLQAKYLLSIPKMNVGDTFAFGWHSEGNARHDVIGRTFRQSVSKISQLTQSPDWVTETIFNGQSDWTATITAFDNAAGQKRLRIDLGAVASGGGGGG